MKKALFQILCYGSLD